MARRTGTRQRRAARASYSGNVIFGGTGWLFADLMLALAMLFIAATSAGTAPSSQAPPPTKPTPSPPVTRGPQVTASPTMAPKRPLDLTPVTVTLNIDPNAVLNGDHGQADAIRKAVLTDHRLAGRQAGLVILFGGGDVDSGDYKKLDPMIWSFLTGPGSSTGMFFSAAVDPLEYGGGGPLTQFQLKIYLWVV
jgi:hypothetical protein